MLRKSLICAVASAALIPTAALAQRGGGGGAGGPPAGVGGMGNVGGLGAGGAGGLGNIGGGRDFGISTRDDARINNQALSHASTTAAQHANWNSVFGGTSASRKVTTGALAGLSTGATLYSNGTAVGTVEQIRTTGNGSVAVVIVKGANGGFYAVPASKLTFNGGTLSTSARLNGVNASADVAANASAQGRANSQGPAHASATGIAHANSHSVLAGGSTTALTGVTVGMPLFSNGTQIGTVFRVVTANGVITRVLVKGSNGRVYSLAPSTLTASGGSLTTSASIRGL